MTARPFTSLDRLVLRLVESGRLPKSSPHACPYISGRNATEEGFLIEELHPEVYHQLMDAGFRRSGKILYRPRCEECHACTPLRVPVQDFTPSRTQRRVWRRNADIRHTITTPPTLDDARFDLYRRYLNHQHPDSPQSEEADRLQGFLYTSCVDTVEVAYLGPDGALLGISILDRSSQSLSSVYHFFDPAARDRSIGVFSVLFEIDLCKQWGIPYYYLGFWIDGSKTMNYKATYRPHELLTDSGWQRPSPTASSPLSNDTHENDAP